MPEELVELLRNKIVDLDGKIDGLEAGCPARKALVDELEIYSKLMISDYTAGQNAIDMAERRRIDEKAKKMAVKAERRKARCDVIKAVVPPSIAAGASIYGSLMLIRMKLALEEEGTYLGNDTFKWAWNFILKLKA